MDLNMLKLGLMLIILIWSIYSGITYMARRSDNKGALRDLRQDGQPARRMTDEEQALVQPFLFDPAKPKKQAQLINDGVYPLHGAFVRHGIEPARAAAPCTTRWAMSMWCCLTTRKLSGREQPCRSGAHRNSPSWWP